MAYAGIAIIRNSDTNSLTRGSKDWHEFLVAHLDSSLERNKQYVIKFKYAMPFFKTSKSKSSPNTKRPNAYYLKNLGVAFAKDTNFVDYDHNKPWYYDSAPNDHFNAELRTFPLTAENYIKKNNLQYAPPGTWKDFEVYFQCPASDSTLQYLIIGNFQYRIPFEDMIEVPDYDAATFDPPDAKIEENYSLSTSLSTTYQSSN